MQAIHNHLRHPVWHQFGCFKEQRYKINASNSQLGNTAQENYRRLFQRAKIQDKCKQFTTKLLDVNSFDWLFQRAKIQDKCKQFTTAFDTVVRGTKVVSKSKDTR